MIYRPIGPEDIDSIVDFATEGLDPQRYPALLFSPEKVRAVIGHFAKTDSDFQLAAFDGERVVGAVAAALVEMMWFERCEAHVVFLYATKPGVGATLLRRLMAWADAHPAVRRVVWAQNEGADKRTAALAKRCSRGFTHAEQTMQVMVKE